LQPGLRRPPASVIGTGAEWPNPIAIECLDDAEIDSVGGVADHRPSQLVGVLA
jgi:hypothetical protein